MDFHEQNILIFGLGRFEKGSGVSAARFFVRHDAHVTVTDMRAAEDLGKTVNMLKGKVKFRLGEHLMSDVRNADIVVRNPGVPNDSPYMVEARKLGIPVMTDISIFMQLCPCPILGVTGTRGKSTTTALLGEMARQVNKKTFVGGNIQCSPLTFLQKLDHGSVAVLELSSWMLESLEDIGRSPCGAIVTNVYPDHLNVHKSMQEYVRVKELIFKYQRPGDHLVLNYDNKETRDMGERVMYGVNSHWFSCKPLTNGLRGAEIKNGWIVVDGARVIPVLKMKLQGAHNVANALSASTMAAAMGVPVQKIAQTLRTFVGLPNRQEMVRKVGGVMWVNDTTATTPEAAMAALARFGDAKKKRIVFVGGGTDKKLEFDALARAVKKYCKAVILFDGTATKKLKKRLRIADCGLRVVKSMRKAIDLAQEIAKRGDTVLLSPGAASFGVFKNEFDRGEQFVKLVKKLK